MERRLKLNICKLPNTADLQGIGDLPQLKTIYIGDALEYACKFWSSHLAKASRSSCDFEGIIEALHQFFTTKFLFWIEVLVLTKNLNIGIYALNDVEQWYISVSNI